jgi:hypothetical protein
VEGAARAPYLAGLCDNLSTHLPNVESREADTKAHDLSVQHRGKSESDILLSMNAEQITAYSEQPVKRPRVEHYWYCHGTQYSHTSAECKVMEADKRRFTSAMCNAMNSQSPPGGSVRKPGESYVR